MIGVSTCSSTKIIKKGDYFSIYIDVTNGEGEPITLTKCKLFQPIGFTLVAFNKQLSLFGSIIETIKDFFSYKDINISLFEGKFQLKPSTGALEIDELPATPYVEVSRPNIEQKTQTIIQPGDTYRLDFNLKAGWSGGLPKTRYIYNFRRNRIYIERCHTL